MQTTQSSWQQAEALFRGATQTRTVRVARKESIREVIEQRNRIKGALGSDGSFDRGGQTCCAGVESGGAVDGREGNAISRLEATQIGNGVLPEAA